MLYRAITGICDQCNRFEDTGQTDILKAQNVLRKSGWITNTHGEYCKSECFDVWVEERLVGSEPNT